MSTAFKWYWPNSSYHTINLECPILVAGCPCVTVKGICFVGCLMLWPLSKATIAEVPSANDRSLFTSMGALFLLVKSHARCVLLRLSSISDVNDSLQDCYRYIASDCHFKIIIFCFPNRVLWLSIVWFDKLIILLFLLSLCHGWEKLTWCSMKSKVEPILFMKDPYLVRIWLP